MPQDGNGRIEIEYSDMWKVGGFTAMIIKLKQNNNIYLPEAIMKALHLQAGQELNIEVKDNQIVISPVFSEAQKLAQEVKEEYEHYKKHPEDYKAYSDVDQMFKDMGID